MPSALVGEWGKWVEALRGLPSNPIAAYFTLTEQRGRKRRAMPLWARLLLAVTAVILLALAYWYLVGGVFGGMSSFSDLVKIICNMALGTGSLILGVAVLRRLFSTCVDAFSLLGQAPAKGKARRLLIDDMTATTTLTDQEIAAGLLYVLTPRLAVLALSSAVLTWLWLLLFELQYGFGAASGGALRLLVGGPLIIMGITLTGTLAAVVTLAWLMVLGNRVLSRFYATAAALMVCFGHILLVPLSFFLGPVLLEMVVGSSGVEAAQANLLRFATAIAFPAAMYVLLIPAVKRPGRFAYLGWLVPVVFPVSLVLLSISFVNSTGSDLRAGMSIAYIQGWVTSAVCNLSAVPSAICLPNLYSQHGNRFVVEWSFLMQVFQLVLMAAVGMRMLGRAVHIRRQELN